MISEKNGPRLLSANIIAKGMRFRIGLVSDLLR